MRDDANRGGTMTIKEYGNASQLIDSIREDTGRTIGSLLEQTGREVAEAEREFAGEMRSFGEAQKRETDAAIENAIYIMKNRAAIEKRKLHLNEVESFIRLMVDEAVADYVTNNPAGYLAFLKRTTGDLLPGVRGSDITVHLRREDAGLEDEMRKFIVIEKAWKGAVDFVFDEAMAAGGVILENRKEGIWYNVSMERYIGRKYDTIRKEVSKIVEKRSRQEQ